MTDKKALIERLATTCHGLDPVDPLRLLVDDVVAALREPEQEPVAWPCLIDSADFSENTITLVMQCEDYKVSAGTHWLSTQPLQRTWVGLTLEQYIAINCSCTTVDQAVGSTERQLKENNT